ncbi:unnamed protein product, partial [Lampetra planeri]
ARGRDRHGAQVDAEGPRVLALEAQDPPRHQGRQHPAQHRRPQQTRRLWGRGPAHGHDGSQEHGDRHAVLDGARSDPGDGLQLPGGRVVAGHHRHRDGRGETALRRHSPHA